MLPEGIINLGGHSHPKAEAPLQEEDIILATFADSCDEPEEDDRSPWNPYDIFADRQEAGISAMLISDLREDICKLFDSWKSRNPWMLELQKNLRTQIEEALTVRSLLPHERIKLEALRRKVVFIDLELEEKHRFREMLDEYRGNGSTLH